MTAEKMIAKSKQQQMQSKMNWSPEDTLQPREACFSLSTTPVVVGSCFTCPIFHESSINVLLST